MTALEALWEQPVTRALGEALGAFLWQGAAVALAVGALLACMKRRPARERYALACLGLLGMTVLPVGSFWVALAGAASEAPRVLAAAPAEVLEAAPATGAALRLEALRPWLLSAWLCGVLLLSLRTVLAWRQAQGLSQQGTREPGADALRALARVMKRLRVSRPVRLLESVAVEGPVVVGLWRPLVLVPASTLAGLPPAQLEAVLAHELAHIRRHDYLVNLLQTLVETVLFYHPAVWWLSARIREEREHCADDLAVESCGDALLYARALAQLEQFRAALPAPVLAATGGSVLGRIRRLLAVPEAGAPRRPWRLAGGLAAAALAVVLGASQQAQATPPPAPVAKSAEALPFNAETMTRPQRLSGEQPQIPQSFWNHTPEAATQGFTKLLLARCTITTEGLVKDCEMVEGHPHLNGAVLEALTTARYTPAREQGRAVAVRYVFNIRIQLDPKQADGAKAP
jgi:beta-lactamase regulating signal transducer with metallopeptidase domain